MDRYYGKYIFYGRVREFKFVWLGLKFNKFLYFDNEGL